MLDKPLESHHSWNIVQKANMSNMLAIKKISPLPLVFGIYIASLITYEDCNEYMKKKRGF